MSKSQYPLLNDREWLLKRRQEGLNAVEIAALVPCHRQAVVRALKRLGLVTNRLPRSGGIRRPKELDDRNWLETQLATKSMRLIASGLGCTYPTVRAAVVRLGITVPKRTTYRVTVDKSTAAKQAYAKRYPNGRTGSQSSNWKGGIRRVPGGYVWIHREIVTKRWPNHPRLALSNWASCQEHILVWEAHEKKLVPQGWEIHHKNTNKHDNRFRNLKAEKSRSDHQKSHWADAMETAKLREEVKRLKAENRRLRRISHA